MTKKQESDRIILWEVGIMKNFKTLLTIILAIVIGIATMFTSMACNNGENSELSVKFVDDTVYARFNGKHDFERFYLSFEEYENGSEKCPSRSYCYAKLLLSFNNTPKGYTAYEIYDIDYVTIDNNQQRICSREGAKYNQIEIIIWIPYYTSDFTHTIQSVTVTSFDSVKGENVQKTIETNYNFESTVVSNWVNRFMEETAFDATIIQSTKEQISFCVDTSIDYDKLIYNATQHRINHYEFEAIVSEGLLAKTNIYTCDTKINIYDHYVEISIVGYQKDGVNYYFSPIVFYTHLIA